jgi:alkanesulfonate monooxygenase SsuD/methylene tetrahydromethanopterin reductase-like flavin-dependent oxidoreductase (luciferase family)
VAGVTAHIRIGVFLSLTGSGRPLRLAEDIGVVDQASRGRIELGLVVPSGDEDGWEALARQLLGAWTEWPVGPGRAVAATPRPAQPWVSRLVVGSRATTAMADRLHAGVMMLDDPVAAEQSTRPANGQRRVVLAVSPETGQDGVMGWLAKDPLQTVLDLRAATDRAGANEATILLPNPPADRLEADITALGAVVATGLRCSVHQAGLLVEDAWNWVTNLGHLHRSPT